jgi:tetratricopeptide (TPR) repeat protein
VKQTSRLILLVVIVSALLAPAIAQDADSLKQSIRARTASVNALVAAGVAKEVRTTGLLQPVGSLDTGQNQTLADENKDRTAIFKLIAHETGLQPDEVASMYGERKSRSMPIGSAKPGPGIGPCNLIPAKTPDALRLVQYLKQGMSFASNKKYDLALAEFKPATAIDSNFLGLHMNISSAQMGLNKYDEAIAAANEELKLVSCLEPLTDAQLASFSYFMEVQDKSGPNRGREQARMVRDRLPKVKATSYYNLACIYSRQRNNDAALDAVQKAVAAGFDDKKALMTDPDLASVRQNPQFATAIAAVGKPKTTP